jgi:hypothetical protein
VLIYHLIHLSRLTFDFPKNTICGVRKPLLIVLIQVIRVRVDVNRVSDTFAAVVALLIFADVRNFRHILAGIGQS